MRVWEERTNTWKLRLFFNWQSPQQREAALQAQFLHNRLAHFHAHLWGDALHCIGNGSGNRRIGNAAVIVIVTEAGGGGGGSGRPSLLATAFASRYCGGLCMHEDLARMATVPDLDFIDLARSV